MSITSVKIDWFIYQRLTTIMYASINDDILINSPDADFPDFPENNRSKWGDWSMAVGSSLSIRVTIEITEAALKQVGAALTANQKIAAAIAVEEPSSETINTLILGLNELNKVIKNDEKFHAALAIGTAVAKEVKKQRGLA